MTELVAPPNLSTVGVDFTSVRFFTYQDVQPFTYRSGVTYTALLETIRKFLGESLVPDVNGNFRLLTESWQENVGEIQDQLNAAIAAEIADVTGALGAQHDSVQAALDAQEATVTEQLAAAVQALQGGSVSVVDPGVAAMLQNTQSQTRGVLDGLYAAKSIVDGINALVTGSGRLTKAALDSAYIVTDAQVAAFASNAQSQTRAAFAAAFSQIQMQVANGYIQYKRTSDATWTNLVSIASLAGPEGPTGTAGAPGGAAELSYAEVASGGTITIATGTGTQDIPGLTLSFVMPSRPVMLELQALIRYVASTGGDAALQLIETTGGGSTVILEGHSGLSATSGDYSEVFARRRITGTAGVTRTFKVSGRKDSAVAWTLSPGSAYPVAVGAYQV